MLMVMNSRGLHIGVGKKRLRRRRVHNLVTYLNAVSVLCYITQMEYLNFYHSGTGNFKEFQTRRHLRLGLHGQDNYHLDNGLNQSSLNVSSDSSVRDTLIAGR